MPQSTSYFRKVLTLAALLFIPAPAAAQTTYYEHVFFDNSLTDSSYFYSMGEKSGKSDLSLSGGKIPVSEQVFYNPPNSLKISWTSATSGFWESAILFKEWRNRSSQFAGNTLSFWMFPESGMEKEALPHIQLEFGGQHRTTKWGLAEFIDSFEPDEWIEIRIPLSRFGINRTDLTKVIFSQGMADGKPHTVYVDHIKIFERDASYKPSPVPENVTAKGYDSHTELTWEVPEQAHYVVIGRSEDGENYEPAGIQRAGIRRYADFTGRRDKQWWYRIKAVNMEGDESEWSEPVSAETKKMTDEELLTMVQEASFRYYWNGAHPNAGMALENIPGNEHLVALGASGFGIMAIVVGAYRGFITRDQAIVRMLKITAFLASADRYHGVWSHFLDGRNGKTIPLFGKYDNGGDLVETSFLIQGLLVARQYFDEDDPREARIRNRITELWESVEWDWYRKEEDSPFLYWHWSPDYKWFINHKLIGFNETMITYLLAIASPTHSVPAEMYYSGWASRSDEAQRYRKAWSETDVGSMYENGNTFYGIKLDVGVAVGGPLFFTHYSYMGFDPHTIQDRYTNYFKNNRAIALINHTYCKINPENHVAYGDSVWGLTASDGPDGYLARAARPARDDGTITPTGAIASFPYTPEQSMKALKYFYRKLGDDIWGIYGFRDAFNLERNWVSPKYMGLNQAPMTVMIENYRTGLIWDLFMANPEIKSMMESTDFIKTDR